MPEPLRLLLADDHRIIREGLSTLIAKYSDMKVVAEAADGTDAVRIAAEVPLDIVIMDITMPGLNGIDATRQILALTPSVHILALSMHADRRFVLEALRAGASGYLLKDCAFEEIAFAVRTAARGGTYLSTRISDLVVREFVSRQQKDEPSIYSILTPREREVLQFIVEGQSTKDIAFRQQVSVKTVETHRQQLMEKLDLHNVAALTKYAIREGITTL